MYCSINGVSYYVEIEGEGFPLVLLHGFTGDSTTWKAISHEWQQKRKLIAIDIIGHGKSDSPMDVNKYDILSVARDLKQILEDLHIQTTDMLGYSMGGRLALSFAVQYPQFLRKLVLESSSPGLKTEEERQKRQIQDEKLADFIREKGIESFVQYWENIPLFASQKRLPQEQQREIKKQRLQNTMIGLSNSLIGMGTGSQPPWWNEIRQLNVETLLLTGALDEKFCQIADQMISAMPNSHIFTFEECGHAIHVEQPEKFGTIVDRFLSNT
jgi:2-succinyl-6-hydroxy-2,4-cyclohexadiene-1-carboxylate synthase